MNYTLAVLTHGNGPTLEECLDSFAEHVTPLPGRTLILRDGPGYSYVPDFVRAGSFLVDQLDEQPRGFCAATRALWQRAAAGDVYDEHEYVFWLEHDFVFTRDVDLRDLAHVLDEDTSLAQLQLMRDAVNEREKAAGGLYESRRDQYEPMMSYVMQGDDTVQRPWLRHQAYMTTNPCLMRRAFMEANPWPDHESECEGRFGIDLIEAGYEFGVWGDGRPWCEHVGVRDGFGY